MSEFDIIQLTAELIAEYVKDGYDPHDLQPGDWVWLDDGGELYMTADEIYDQIGRVEDAISNGCDESWGRRRDVLRDALRRIREAQTHAQD